ncbi:MAG: mechanosensitive ion channel [Microcoleaceae cyanobacterium]
MIGIYNEIPHLLGSRMLTLSHLHLGQQGGADPLGLGGLAIGSFSVIDIVVALAVLVIGYIVALFVKALIKSLLKKTDVDNKIASWVSGGRTDADTLPVEEWIGSIVFWVIFLFAIIGFLERLQLSSASSPLTSLLNQITAFIPRVLAAAALLGIAWVVATLVRALVIKVLDTFGLDRRLNNQVGNNTTTTTVSGTTTTTNQFSLSETIGNALYWFIFLLFLLPILDTLNLQGLLTPIQQMLNEVLFMLPNILAAILIGATGWVIAQVVRKIVTNLLTAIGTDQFGRRFGLSQATGTQGLSSILGTVVYVLILIPIAIAALNALQIDAISVPAIEMLSQVLNIIPQIFAAGVILVVFYVIGRFVSELITSILTSFGFNKLFYWLGLQSTPPIDPTISTPPAASEVGEPTVLQSSSSSTKTPSEIVGIVAFVGIILFAVVTATDILGLASLTLILEQIIVIAGRVLIGVIVFAVGLYFANLAYRLVYSSGSGSSKILAQTARIAIIVFVGAMALQMMGIASDIVNLAFGLLLGAIAVAIAISFGLGGRDIAAEEIRSFLGGFKKKQ